MKNGNLDIGMLTGKNVLLGVTGGIGAYKAASLVRDLQREGARVSVVMTENATRFISPLTLETLSGYPVGLDMFSLTDERTIGHIDRAAWADVLVIAPATANYIGKAASGIADDLLTTITMAVTCPLVIAPAMNSKMWSNPALINNLEVLVKRGARIVSPGTGELACGEEGPGRLAEAEFVIEEVVSCLAKKDLSGIKVLVSAGPTREAVDPVRFITNRSSGRMGYAVAAAASRRGAEVTLVSGPVEIKAPPAVNVRNVNTAKEMLAAISESMVEADWLIMAAAVADYAPAVISEDKLKKDDRDVLTLHLDKNPDILQNVAGKKTNKLVVGFAAETRDLLENAAKKLHEKDLDLIVANDISGNETGFDTDENCGVILGQQGFKEEIPRMPKMQMAGRILDAALDIWRRKRE
ncbi:MAG: bifunctional phosphopantothenoylcysteine decarboxylase/phosphopantothenate--cysteine ligase CoaBC [Pseudomonadota bacterium]